jgi:hypothetical protein
MLLTEHTYYNSMIGNMFENRGRIHYDECSSGCVCVCVSRRTLDGSGEAVLPRVYVLDNNSVPYGIDRHIKTNYENKLRLFEKLVKSQRHRGFQSFEVPGLRSK